MNCVLASMSFYAEHTGALEFDERWSQQNLACGARCMEDIAVRTQFCLYYLLQRDSTEPA